MKSLWFGALVAVVGLSWTPATQAGDLLPTRSSVNVIRNAGNGIGNNIIIDNQDGSGSSTTVLSNSRNGIGNQVIIRNNGGTMIFGAGPCYRGKDNQFWTRKHWSDDLGCTVYWSPDKHEWFYYEKDGDCYRPVWELFETGD